MNTKTLLIIVVVFIVLVGGWWAMNRAPQAQPAGADWGLKAISADKVDNIIIKEGTTQVELKKGSAGWSVNGQPADAAAITRIWDSLKGSALTGPVSRNKNNHASFDLVELSGRIVELKKDGKDVLAFMIGKSGVDYNSSYVRKLAEDAVYVVAPSLRSVFSTIVDDWKVKVEPKSATEKPKAK